MFVAIEGIDGSGKGTQAQLLYDRCLGAGLSAAKIAFPQYGKTPFAEAIKEYLNGEYGGVREVHPKLIGVLFAADRFAVREDILEAVRTKDIVVCDRYVASNMAHQAAKLPSEERNAFVKWLECIEYGIFGLPRADLTLYLDMPVRQARKLVEKKPSRAQDALFGDDRGAYTDLKEDIHEADAEYLVACRRTYEQLAQAAIGGPWKAILGTAEDGSVRSPEAISKEIWDAVSSMR